MMKIGIALTYTAITGAEGHPHPASDCALSIQHSLGGGCITPAEHVAMVCWLITTHGQAGVYKKKKARARPPQKKFKLGDYGMESRRCTI